MRKVDTAEERWRRELPEQGFLLSLVKALVISVGLFEWDMHPTSNEKLCQSFSSSTGIGLQITRSRFPISDLNPSLSGEAWSVGLVYLNPAACSHALIN